MTHRRLLFVGFAALVLYPFPSCPAADTEGSSPKATFWLIPHTHWEGAVFKTREEYLEMGTPNILMAMRLLREQPGFRFRSTRSPT